MWNDKTDKNEKKQDTQGTDATRTPNAAAEPSAGWLGPSFRVKGDITGTEDLLIDGAVEGLVELDKWKLTVGPAAKVNADINARDVVVYGAVKGNVHAKGRIEIRKDGSIIGNLTTAQIMIEDGANFKGSIEIERLEAKAADKSVSARAAAAGGGSAGD